MSHLRGVTDSPQLGIHSPSPHLRGGSSDSALFHDHLNLDDDRTFFYFFLFIFFYFFHNKSLY